MGKKRASKKKDGPQGPAAGVLVDVKESSAEAERKTLAAIRSQAERSLARHSTYLQAKEEAAVAKGAWEAAAEALQEMCLAKEKTLPLFESAESPSNWRDVRLDVLEPPIKASALGKLKETGIETIGQLADYTQKHDLLAVPGIGQAKKTAIEASLDAFWKSRGDVPQEAERETLFTPPAEKPDAAKAKAGTCRVCGCTEEAPCPGGCAWADKTKTLCTKCANGQPTANTKGKPKAKGQKKAKR